MAASRTYTVGLNGEVWRMTNHDKNTWLNLSLDYSNLIGQANPLNPNLATGNVFPFIAFNGYHLVDVMADPNDNEKFCTIVGNNPRLLPTTQSDYFNEGKAGIFMSHNAGATWFVPGGDWVDLCKLQADTLPEVNFHFEVWYADSNTIYVVSEGGYIFKSIDGGLTFNSIKNTAGNPKRAGGAFQFTSCIHMWKDTTGINGGLDYGVIAQQEDITQVDSNVLVWKTLDGGVTWTALNGGNPLRNTFLVPPSDQVGNATGIYMSQDQSMITVQCAYITNRSLDSGANFYTTLETARNGLHLTWNDPYDPFVSDLWVSQKGISLTSIDNSTDAAGIWTSTLNNGSRTDGAHFYTSTNGYLTAGVNVVSTTQSGTNPQPSLNGTSENFLLAIWTTSEPLYLMLVDCANIVSNIIVTDDQNGFILFPYVSSGTIIQIQGNVDIDPTTCWSVHKYDSSRPTSVPIVIDTTLNVITQHKNCAKCLPPPPPTECWKLELCPFSTGTSCQTIENHTGFDWTPWENEWVYINEDTTCIYKPIKIMQAIFVSPDSYSVLCALPTPWADDVQYEITSLTYNNAQYIIGAAPSYIMSDAASPGINAYDPVECTALVCTSVACGTTENSYSNVPDFINDTLVTLGLDNVLEAYPNDTNNTPSVTYSDTSFKMQYADGDEFTIVIKRTVGASVIYYNYIVGSGIGNGVAIGDPLTSATKFITGGSEVGSSLCSDTTLIPVVDTLLVNPVEITVCEDIICDIEATYTSTNITVNGGSNGTITVSATGNVGPITYLWNTGDTTASLTGLLPGVYTVTVSDLDAGEDCFVTLTIILTEPPAPPPPEACEVTPRLGEPGFSVRNCDPKTVIKIKSKFADSIYALFKRMRYGIETCCEFDLDKIDIKHQLLELGEMNDPDACVLECNRYNITNPNNDETAKFTYKDCFGAAIITIIPVGREEVTLSICARPNTIVTLDNPINIEFVEKCCDPVQSIITADTTGVILWFDYEGLVKRKTLTTIEGSCGPDGVDKIYVCAQEGTVTPYPPLLITDLDITEMGAC